MAERASYLGMARGLKMRLPAIRHSLRTHARLPLVGACAIVVIGLGTVAVDATTGPRGAQWLGSLDDAKSGGKATRLLGAAAVGLGAEVRRVEADRSGRLQTLRAQVRTLAERQARLAERLASIESGPDLHGVHDTLSALAERQAGIESKLTAAVELAAMKAKLPSLDDEVRVLRLVAAALLLREGAQSAQPFEPALERFASLAARVDVAYPGAGLPPVTEHIASLRPYAETGVVSSRDLRRSFVPLTALVERAAASGWWESVMVLVGWHDDPLQPLHEAQVALMVDDLSGAVASLTALQGEAALVTDGWLTLARARLATDALVDDLYRLALAAGTDPAAAPSTVASSSSPAATPREPFVQTRWQAAQTVVRAGLSR